MEVPVCTDVGERRNCRSNDQVFGANGCRCVRLAAVTPGTVIGRLSTNRRSSIEYHSSINQLGCRKLL